MSKIILEEQAAADTPSTNKVAVYPKSDGKLYVKDDAGTETSLTFDPASPGAIGGTTPAAGAFTTIAASGNVTPANLTASKLVATDASKNLVSIEPTVFETGGAQQIDGDKLDIDFSPTNYTPDTTPAEANHADNLAAHLAGIDNALGNWYGVSWNETADSYTRRGSLAGQATGTKPDDALLPIQASMRRCVVSDAGVVQYYLYASDSTKKADGSAADLTGGDGQVMVEIPKFYIRYAYSSPTHSWDISFQPLAGFVAHPAFFKDGAWVDHRYFGAYEGSMYDASATAMVGAADIVTAYTIAAGDLLCSVSGQYPKVNETRADYRTMASQRGAGWRQQDFFLTAAVQLLYLVEYADFDSQTMIGNGRTMFSSGNWTADSVGDGSGYGGYIGQCGYSNADGNATNATDRAAALNISAIDTSQAAYQDYMTYRGIENFFGNVWQWVDGINVNDNIPYACNNPDDFADDTATGYDRLVDVGGNNVTLHNANGYIGALEQLQAGFLPADVTGSDATKICDYYYQDPGWRVVFFGGVAYVALNAGAFCVHARRTSSSDNVDVGGRICY